MPSEKMQFKIAGMDCAEEVTMLKKELAPILGGESRLSFDVINEILSVSQGSVSLHPQTRQARMSSMSLPRYFSRPALRPKNGRPP